MRRVGRSDFRPDSARVGEVTDIAPVTRWVPTPSPGPASVATDRLTRAEARTSKFRSAPSVGFGKDRRNMDIKTNWSFVHVADQSYRRRIAEASPGVPTLDLSFSVFRRDRKTCANLSRIESSCEASRVLRPCDAGPGAHKLHDTWNRISAGAGLRQTESRTRWYPAEHELSMNRLSLEGPLRRQKSSRREVRMQRKLVERLSQPKAVSVSSRDSRASHSSSARSVGSRPSSAGAPAGGRRHRRSTAARQRPVTASAPNDQGGKCSSLDGLWGAERASEEPDEDTVEPKEDEEDEEEEEDEGNIEGGEKHRWTSPSGGRRQQPALEAAKAAASSGVETFTHDAFGVRLPVTPDVIKQHLLAHLPLIADTYNRARPPPAFMDVLIQGTAIMHVHRGDFVCIEDQDVDGDECWLVFEGRLRASKASSGKVASDASSEKPSVMNLGPGATFGNGALFSRVPSDATVVVVSDRATLLEIGSDVMAAAFAAAPEYEGAIIRARNATK